MAHHHRYFITLLALCFVIQISWAKYCRDDDDCPSNQFCIDDTCEKSTGIPTCQSDFECGIHEKCIGRKCIESDSCTSSNQCPGSQICWIGTCTYCYSDSQCLIGEICENQACVTGCRRYSSTCSIGKKCINNICQLPSSYGPCEYNSDCPGSQVCSYSTCTDRPSSPNDSAFGFALAIFVVVGLIVTCIAIGVYQSHSRIIPPPTSVPTCDGVVPMPNHSVAIPPCYIQIIASSPSLGPAAHAKPPPYNEVVSPVETPYTPPPQYSNLPPAFLK